jgi:hypothetical protein
MKKTVSKKKTILYLHITSDTKVWLKSLCKKQVGRVSQSTMAERIFVAAQKNPKFIRAA